MLEIPVDARLETDLTQARVTVVLAMREISLRCTGPIHLRQGGLLGPALDRLSSAVGRLEQVYDGEPDLVRLRVRCALAATQAWHELIRMREFGWLSGAERGLDALMDACRFLVDGVLPPSDELVLRGAVDALRGPNEDLATALALEVFRMASNRSRDELSESALQCLRELPMSARKRATLLMDITTSGQDRSTEESLEEFVRLVHLGRIDDEPASVRQALAKRFAMAVGLHRKRLKRNSMSVSSAFWRWEITRVESRLTPEDQLQESRPGVPHAALVHLAGLTSRPDEDAGETGGAARVETMEPEWLSFEGYADLSASQPQSTNVPQLQTLRTGITNQNPKTVARGLHQLALLDAQVVTLNLGHLSTLLDGVEDWCRSVTDVPVGEDARASKVTEPWDVFRVRCLTAADHLAQTYLHGFRPQILGTLSQIEALPVTTRLAAIGEAMTVAGRYAMWAQSIEVARRGIDSLIEQGASDDLPMLVDLLCKHFVAELSTTNRGVAFYEVASSGSRQLERVSVALAAGGYAREAFKVAQVSRGWLSRALADDARFVDDYQALLELEHHRGSDHARLYSRIEARLCSEEGSQPLIQARLPASPIGQDVMHVLYIVSARVWAMTARCSAGAIKYSAIELQASRDDVREIVERLWAELRPSRVLPASEGRRRSTASLRELYDVFVAPVRARAGSSDELIFTPTGEMTQLPLHAALAPDGYVIAHHACRYNAHRWEATSPLRASAPAVVGGWDPEVGAPEESREVAGVLRAMGVPVESTRNAAAGRAALLDGSLRVCLVHVAAHGDLRPGPDAPGSALHLSPSVEVSAGELMRVGLRAEFVFLNACALGRAMPQGGDVSGFPLALRVRGCQSSLTSLGDLAPNTAHDFASAFYASLRSKDSFDSYMTAVRSAVREDAHPATWAPYVYEGWAVQIGSVRSIKRSQPRRARRKGSRRR